MDASKQASGARVLAVRRARGWVALVGRRVRLFAAEEALTPEEAAHSSDEAVARYAPMVGDDLSDEEARRRRRPHAEVVPACSAHGPETWDAALGWVCWECE